MIVVNSFLLLTLLIPAIPMALAWYREVKSKSSSRNGALWLPLTLETLALFWLLTSLCLGADFSTHRIDEVWLNVAIAVASGGLSIYAASPHKLLVTAGAGGLAMEWIFVLLIQSSV